MSRNFNNPQISPQASLRLTTMAIIAVGCGLIAANSILKVLASRERLEPPAIGTYEILHSFTGNAGYGFTDTDGANPYGPLIQAADGNFYGTTMNGSATATGPTGTIFKMTVAGQITILHHFLAAGGGDGVTPYGGLTLAKDGNFYGTTYNAPGCTGSGAGCGVVFRISPS